MHPILKKIVGVLSIFIIVTLLVSIPIVLLNILSFLEVVMLSAALCLLFGGVMTVLVLVILLILHIYDWMNEY